jgi:hypothetical protein
MVGACGLGASRLVVTCVYIISTLEETRSRRVAKHVVSLKTCTYVEPTALQSRMVTWIHRKENEAV